MTNIVFVPDKKSSLADVQAFVNAQLMSDFQFLFQQVCLPNPLVEAAHYGVANGGKRVRPLLVLCAFLTLGGEIPHHFSGIRRAMMAVEMIHGYSLVHDDLPCMDNDVLRRGLPTCHIEFGEATALLAGDVLQSLAFEVLTMPFEGVDIDWQEASRLMQVLATSARRLVAGQMLDLNGEGADLTQLELECIHRDKTGALIEASVLMGGLCALARQENLMKLSKYAEAIGLAFQVQDDVLDVVADTQTLGKTAGSDEKLAKSTYVRLLGVEGAAAYAHQLFCEARAQVEAFGEDNLLLQLLNWLEQRTY